MEDIKIRNGTKLCYKKNENGYCWVTVTGHGRGRIRYVREGKTVIVSDAMVGTRLFVTLSDARKRGLVLDDAFEQSDEARRGPEQ